MDAPGGLVFSFAWAAALLVSLGLSALRRSLLPALAVGAVLAVAVLIETARIGDTITRTDVVAVFTACALGAFCAVAPVAYIRWVRRVFDQAERNLTSH
jgi:hypothetical protein